MSDELLRYPLLDTLYQQYLEHESSADFIRAVCESYTLGSICRLAKYGQTNSRRAAIMTLGFLGDFSHNEIMGTALNDSDRAVRMLADHGIRGIWPRQGEPRHQQSVRKLYQLVSRDQTQAAIELANRLLWEDESLAEAWNQRAIAYCAEGDFVSAIEDCCETLNRNRFHFPAAIGMAHCCLQLDDLSGALSGFKLAISINPDLEGVRSQIHQLERASEN
jgi:tetratricopeptide (TPR) repeat protein